jgi:hypothetical protein
MMARHEHHVGFTSLQQRQQRMAFADRSLRADFNHGRPPVAATARAAMFHGNGVFAARASGGPVHFSSAHSAAPMRSDRPSWASGQNRAPHPLAHGARPHGQPGLARPQQQRFEGRPQGHNFASRPQSHSFEAHGSRPMKPSEARPQPQFHQNNFRALSHAPAMRGPAPHPQQRGGGERPHHPPEGRGHNR